MQPVKWSKLRLISIHFNKPSEVICIIVLGLFSFFLSQYNLSKLEILVALMMSFCIFN